MVVGVDEAGKGPVLGPMVAAAVRADPDALPADVDDSKRVAPARREEMATRLRGDPEIRVGVGVVGVGRIDDPATDMNSLTVAAQAEAAAAVADAGDRLTVDAGDVDAARFGRRVREAVADTGTEVTVTAEHRADESYPVVGAASVVAKVERDARVASLADRHDADVGSGYPSDPTTRAFLREYVRAHGDLPDGARRSWSTCDDLLAAAEQSALGDF
ncbi:ribonuclease HII [Candidatus Halobonum tyrrellensis]|uniref:ribonuclease HII n=1 Tax=Candidatus Halobonum tyrrellensis TaxID=1431545 RepID=UPI000677E051|nr:ribonuclease HII [Candidatus Halobonum tyrrellensis]